MTEQMNMIGTIVRSKSGRDRRRCYVVVEVDTEKTRAYISDGRLRPLERLKAKNPRHLEFVCDSPEAREQISNGTLTNRSLRELLSNYNHT